MKLLMEIKMNKIKIILLLLITVIFTACNPKCDVNDITASELLLINAQERNIDYCNLLTSASTNDKAAIKQISLLKFENAVGYDHGIVLVGLIQKIGERNYINAIQGITTEEKSAIISYIEIGIEYGGSKHKQNFKIRYPKLFTFLMSTKN